MLFVKLAAMGLLLGSAYVSAGDCVNPTIPSIPDGASSTMEQMIAGQKAVKVFQTANLEYMACLEPTLAAASIKADKGAAKEAYDEVEASYNAAVSAEEEVAGQFNAAIREYKTANPN